MTKIAPDAADLLERDLQRHVRAFATSLGWRVQVAWTSIHSPRGWPDLTCYRPHPSQPGVGEMVYIELKREKGKTTEPQDWWLAALATVPGTKWAGVIRPSDWYAGALDEVLR